MAVKPSEVKQRNQEYYDKREEKKATRYYKTDSKEIRRKDGYYKTANNEMEKEVNAFYAKYGKVQEAPKIDDLGVATETETALVVDYNTATKKAGSRSKQTRLQVLLGSFGITINELYKKQNKSLEQYLSAIASENYNESVFEVFKGVGHGQRFNKLSDAALSQLIRTPFSGLSFTQRYTQNRDWLASNVNQVIRDGITKGLSNKDMVKELMKKTDSSSKSANRLIRTYMNNAYGQSNLEGYKASGVANRYEYIATLDNRTSEQCQELDGENFALSEAIPGVNYPPVHYNCRSTTSIMLDSTTKAGTTRIARDMSGKTYTVPGNTTYSQWKKQQGIE